MPDFHLVSEVQKQPANKKCQSARPNGTGGDSGSGLFHTGGGGWLKFAVDAACSDTALHFLYTMDEWHDGSYFPEPPEPGSVKLGPGIQAQRKVYIQWRKEKRLEFVTGGYAYLLPRTSVVLHCPAQRSRKDQVMWLKNGKPLASVPHLSITATGFLKIQRIAAPDAGVYTCVAGQAHEDFVLKLLGSKQKLAVLDDSLWLAGSQEKLHPELLGRYDAIVQRLLELKGPGWDGPISGDLRGSAERNMSSMEGEPAGEAHDPPTLEAETWKLDEILRNLSRWPGELGGTHGMEVLIQLLGELTRYHGDINESAFYHPEEPKRAANSHISTSNVTTDSPRSGSFTHSPGAIPQAPIIVQRSQKIDDSRSPSEVVVFVGVPLQLSKLTSSVVIRCETLGHPKPVLTWSKDGEELCYSTRYRKQVAIKLLSLLSRLLKYS